MQAIENEGSHSCGPCASDVEKFGGDNGAEGVSEVDAKIVSARVNMGHGSMTKLKCK